MALIHCRFQSLVLSLEMSMIVIMPENRGGVRQGGEPIKGDCPVLYLLHGYSADESDWIRKSGIERYVDERDLAVVMPSGLNSFYVNSWDGSCEYFRYISEELPQRLRQFFHVSDRREDTFVAGFSMGGYGAFKLALTYPEKFSAAASLSGALDIVALYEDPTRDRSSHLKPVFGELDDLKGSDNDLLALSKKLKSSGKDIPRLYQCCGIQDSLYPVNVKFRDHLRALDYNFIYDEGPGNHDWNYWDPAIQKIVKWLPIQP
jgi:putative tributyrin esterase